MCCSGREVPIVIITFLQNELKKKNTASTHWDLVLNCETSAATTTTLEQWHCRITSAQVWTVATDKQFYTVSLSVCVCVCACVQTSLWRSPTDERQSVISGNYHSGSNNKSRLSSLLFTIFTMVKITRSKRNTKSQGRVLVRWQRQKAISDMDS